MRLFGSERIAKVVDRLGMEDGEALEAPMLSKSIETAQKKVEENNFGIRKRLLEYDDVMNTQREVIYTKRRNALSGERVEIDIDNLMQDIAYILVESCDGIDYKGFEEEVIKALSIDPGFDEEFYNTAKPRQKADALYAHMQEVYKRRMDTIAQKAYPVIKTVYEKQGQMYTNILIPISDGYKQLSLGVNLEKAVASEGREIARELSKTITLYNIDELWKQHLRDMDDLKQSVQNASYEQKDPLLIYKLESSNLFDVVLETLCKNVLSFLFRAHIPLRDASEVRQEQSVRKPERVNYQTSRSDLVTNGETKARTPVHVDKKIRPNDPCPCGSGKKYKHCHGQNR